MLTLPEICPWEVSNNLPMRKFRTFFHKNVASNRLTHTVFHRKRSRPASMISDTSKKQRWTQRIANKRPKFPNPFSTSLRRRGSQRSNTVPSEVMEKGKLLFGKQYDGPMNRTRTSDSIETLHKLL